MDNPIREADLCLNNAGEFLDRLQYALDVLEEQSNQLGTIIATLKVNCQDGAALHKLGISYDETKTASWNVANVLIKMNETIETLKKGN